jgi:hypothetical protein
LTSLKPALRLLNRPRDRPEHPTLLIDTDHTEAAAFKVAGLAPLLATGAPIDGFGVGTALGTSSDVPALDVRVGSRRGACVDRCWGLVARACLSRLNQRPTALPILVSRPRRGSQPRGMR